MLLHLNSSWSRQYSARQEMAFKIVQALPPLRLLHLSELRKSDTTVFLKEEKEKKS